jgi:D-3-phosphoglycerate dehydrogenase
LSGFGPRIIAYDPYVNKDEAKALGVEMLSLEEVMRQSDFVSVHARLLPATEGLIGAKELSFMKPTAVFVNTARAGLVDEKALVEVLEAKKIRGAALDVFSEEPLPADHPLLKLNNVILTPHMAGGAGDTFTITVDIVREELHRYFKGEKLLNTVN